MRYLTVGHRVCIRMKSSKQVLCVVETDIQTSVTRLNSYHFILHNVVALVLSMRAALHCYVVPAML